MNSTINDQIVIGKIKYYDEQRDIGAIVAPNSYDRDITFSSDDINDENMNSLAGCLVTFDVEEIDDNRSSIYACKKFQARNIEIYRRKWHRGILGARLLDYTAIEEIDGYIKLVPGMELLFDNGFKAAIIKENGHLYLNIGEVLKD